MVVVLKLNPSSGSQYKSSIAKLILKEFLFQKSGTLEYRNPPLNVNKVLKAFHLHQKSTPVPHPVLLQIQRYYDRSMHANAAVAPFTHAHVA